MANDKKNLNRLVTGDDDPTAELEVLVLPDEPAAKDLEAAACTASFSEQQAEPGDLDDSVTSLKSDLLSRSATIDRLQFDMEVLRSKSKGLSTEIKARDEQVSRLNIELKAAQHSARQMQELLQGRDATISELRRQVQQHEQANRDQQEELAARRREVSAGTAKDERLTEQLLVMQSGQLASSEQQLRELHARLENSEDYADQLRYQLRLRDADAAGFGSLRESLEQRLEVAGKQLSVLRIELQQMQDENANLSDNISRLHDIHAEEIRMIRFELGDAQETLTQHELVAEQLASDLVETRSHRTELEQMLAETEANSKLQIESLETQNQDLLLQVENLTDKLQTKSEAINCLLAELAKKSSTVDPIADIEDAIEEIDARMSHQIDDRSHAGRDRVTRVLVGKIDNQELRFPLFKDRLTLGRTRQNDIQLKSAHISRRHAVVVIEGDVTRVIDWGSKNGVFVNSKRIKEHFLKNGDIVGVGTAEFRYEERPKRDH